jgi:radical SAM protein with 4Fe4S-binding SPASM domain
MNYRGSVHRQTDAAVAIAVIARSPRRGGVKTRLATDIGGEAAYRVYCRLLLQTMVLVESVGAGRPMLALASGSDAEVARTPASMVRLLGTPHPCLHPESWSTVRQRGDGLGERLANVFADLFAAGHEAVVLVNGDSPALPTEYLQRALRLLHEGVAAGHRDEVVIGPATDGGFYLIGAHRATWEAVGEAADGAAARTPNDPAAPNAIAAALAAAPMGTAAAAVTLVGALTAAGLHVRQLPLWLDVDVAADLPAYERLMSSERQAVSEPDRLGAEGPNPGAGELLASRPDRSDTGDPADPRPGAASGGTGARLRGEPLVGLREIYLHVTNRCGLGCPHCYNRTNPRDPGELTTSERRDAIDQCVALGASSFVFLGGDPLLRIDLFDLIEYVTGTHRRKARIFFNGECTEEMARQFATAGHARLRPLLSVDGDQEANDELRGDGNFAATLAAIRNLTAAGLAPVVNTVALAMVLPTLPAMARAVKRAGATRLHLILPHQRGGLVEHLDMVPSGKAMLAAVKELAATCAEIDLVFDNLPSWRRRVGDGSGASCRSVAPGLGGDVSPASCDSREAPARRRQDFCTAGIRDLAIDPFGTVYGCTITCGDPAFAAGDLRRERLEDVWRYSPALRLLRAGRARDRAECSACPVVDACGGECWMQAHYAARIRNRPAGLLAPFPYCDLVRPLFQELMAEAAAKDGPLASPAADPRDQATGEPCGVAVAGGEPCGVAVAGGEADYTLFDCI